MPNDPHQLEQDRLIFEKMKLEKEYLFKEKELLLREKELANGKVKVTPAQITIIVTLIGILGTLIGSYIQGMSNQKLEKLRFESDLITKVVSSNDLVQNKKNLKFLLDAGLITDNDHKIEKLVNDTSFDVKIPQNISRPRLSFSYFSGIVRNEVGVPLKDVIIRVLNDSSMETKTNKNGLFFFGLPFNQMDVEVILIKSGFEPLRTKVTLMDEAWLSADLRSERHKH
jgi:hypothetical protein